MGAKAGSMGGAFLHLSRLSESTKLFNVELPTNIGVPFSIVPIIFGGDFH